MIKSHPTMNDQVAADPDNVTHLCQRASHIVSNGGFQAVLFLEILQSIIASVLNIILMGSIWRVSVFHTNLRLLLFHHSLTLTLCALGAGARAAYIFTVSQVIGDPCQLVISMYDCKLQEIGTIVPLVNGVYSLIALCLERAYATVRYRTYDQADTVPWLAGVLIVLIWVVSLWNQLRPLAYIPRQSKMPVCSNLLTVSPSVAATVLGLNASVEVCAVILALGLFYTNRKLLENSLINRAQHTLSARFQVYQNVTVNRLLLPTIAWHAICFLCLYVHLLLTVAGLQLEESTKLLLLHVTYCVILFYAIGHPILAFTKNPHLKNICDQYRQGWSKCGSKNAAVANVALRQNTITAGASHFETLERMWNSVEVKKAARRL